MVMHDEPSPVQSAKPEGRAYPHVHLSSVRHDAGNAVQERGEADITVDRDLEIVDFVPDAVRVGGEPCLSLRDDLVTAGQSQRRYDVECDDVVGETSSKWR